VDGFTLKSASQAQSNLRYRDKQQQHQYCNLGSECSKVLMSKWCNGSFVIAESNAPIRLVVVDPSGSYLESAMLRMVQHRLKCQFRRAELTWLK
jgi:hypothetical protein